MFHGLRRATSYNPQRSRSMAVLGPSPEGFLSSRRVDPRVPLPPKLTDEERHRALQKAAQARRKRAELKDQLKSGRKTFKDVLALSNDDIVGKMKVSAVLESLPGVGPVRARKIMERLDISDSRRMRGLGQKQKENLLGEFARR